ncbi:MAG: ATP-binding protein [Bacteroidaceae bacterium]|nr:ATP-binding protein [Bacteroidaceae bacterium]
MSIARNTLKQVLLDNQKDVERYDIFPRHYDLDSFPLMIFVGVRRSGKSFLLFQKMRQLLAEGKGWDEMLYLDFEDTRLEGFTADDFNLILECHQEMYGKRPMLFLDEIQNVDGWQKFARNLADKKYSVFITGSNAKMLSKEIMAALGGRYLPVEVYPFRFKEYLSYTGVPYDDLALTGTESKARFMKAYGEFFTWGGLPESINLPVKRNYLSSIFQKIYLGDIVQRNGISNPRLLQLMIKKVAESVMQPVSYNRISKILSSVSGKISVPTVSNYISFSEDAWLLLRLRNIASSFSDKESICKYYFIDNGLLTLQLLNSETILLENLVALSLFRKYGHDEDNERVFFYNTNVEVDFYVPEDELAIQVSYSIADPETEKREKEPLEKLPNMHPCRRRIIITYDEEGTLTDKNGSIEVIPCWKWLLEIEAID